MRTSISLYRSCMQIFTLLYIQGTQGMELLDSLTCVNNFKTHWMCHWKEMAKLQEMLPMSLYHWNKLRSFRHRCDPVHTQNQDDGRIHMSCQFNAKFSSSVNTSFSFIPEWDVHAETCFMPSSKVRMPPPKDLKVQMSDNGKISLNWKMANNGHSSASLLYQVSYYRKNWEMWEDAISLNVLGKMKVTFNPQSFVPGSTYFFRVRSVPPEDPAYRSAWSKELTWTMPADHGAIIQNVNCVYDGSMKMNCSWEVRKELMSYVSFSLYYTESPAECDNSSSNSSASHNSMKVCLGKITEIKDCVPYVQYSCTLQVPSFQANNFFSIQVRTQEKVKSLLARENIQTEPPTDLQIKVQSKNGYTLRWSPPEVEFSTIQLTYQLCYWKEGDPECLPHSVVNVSGNLPEYYFPISKLEGSTQYRAKVRAKPDEMSGYNGPWSEWSQSSTWKTTIVLTTDVICIAAFIISIIVSLFAYFAFRYYKRLKQKLDDSLPNPSKSKLLSSHSLGYWKQSFYPFIHRDFYAEEEPSICFPISSVEPQSTSESTEELVTNKAPNPDVCPLGPYSLPPPAKEKIMPDQSKCESLSTGKESDVTTVPTSEGRKSLSNKSYNGPYLMFTGSQSMSNLVSNEAKHPGYFSLPKCQNELFSLPIEATQSCQPRPTGDQMGYVISMEKPLSVQSMQNQDIKCAPDVKYFAIPPSSDFKVSPEGPLMMINPDGSGPLLLKQVGDYCFFPGLRGSQENLERKVTTFMEQNQQKLAEDPPLSAVQTFKVMQRGYLALPHS